MDWTAIALSLKLAALVAGILLVLALPIAYWLTFSRWRGKCAVEAHLSLASRAVEKPKPRVIRGLCEVTEPPLVEVEPGHMMSCHIPIEELRTLQRKAPPPREDAPTELADPVFDAD